MLNNGLFAKYAKLSINPDERLPQGKAPMGSLSWGKLDTDDGSVWQTKLDGAFMYYTLDPEGIRAYSWRRSTKDGKPIEHTEKIHGLEDVEVPRHLQGAILRGEAWDPGRTASEVGAVLNTRKTPMKGELRPALHGITYLPSVDVNTLSNKEQISMLKRITKDLGVFDLPDMATTPEQKRKLKNLIASGNHPQTKEGIVVYPSQGTPMKSVLRPTVDVPVVGITPGLGKFEDDGIGALLVGSSDNPSRVGTGYTDDIRRALWEKPELLKGLVAKVEVRETFPSGKFRGASFKGFHPEKSDPDALNKLDEYMKSRGFSKEAGVNRDEAIKRINRMKNIADRINIEVRKGEWRKETDKVPYPFTYGEIPGLINDADGDPWDVVIMPGATVGNDLRVVGYIPTLKTKGNDKLLLGNEGIASKKQQKQLEEDIVPIKKFIEDPIFFPKTAVIKQEGSKYKLYTRDGSRVLGTHDTYEKAMKQEYAIEISKHKSKKKHAEAEFAPGIPFSRDIKPLPEALSQKLWEIAIHDHQADKAGRHYDLRLADPDTGYAHSWALPKASLPEGKQRIRLAIQQPTHTMEYMDFEGEISEGYGAGKVELPVRGQTDVDLSPGRIQFDIPGKGTFVLRQKEDNQWMLLKKGSRVLAQNPGEFSKHAASAIKPLLAALVGVPLAGAAYGVSQHPEDPLKAMSGAAIGASTGAGAGAITGAGLMALLQYLGKTGLRPQGLATGAVLGGLAGAALGAREGAQAPVGVTGSERDRLLASILQELQNRDKPEPWQPDLLR